MAILEHVAASIRLRYKDSSGTSSARRGTDLRQRSWFDGSVWRPRRVPERKRAGKQVATVEVDGSILAMLARGTHIDVETRDRAQLNDAVGRALQYYAKR